jgi:hypothetical protein
MQCHPDPFPTVSGGYVNKHQARLDAFLWHGLAVSCCCYFGLTLATPTPPFDGID